jgi:hypothetical protein
LVGQWGETTTNQCSDSIEKHFVPTSSATGGVLTYDQFIPPMTRQRLHLENMKRLRLTEELNVKDYAAPNWELILTII